MNSPETYRIIDSEPGTVRARAPPTSTAPRSRTRNQTESGRHSDKFIRMVHSLDDVVARLDERFLDGHLGDGAVRRQSFQFLPAAWNKRWPEDLPKPAILASGNSRVWVSRQDVFERARSIETPKDAVDLYLLMCAWGTGTKARAVARSARPLWQPALGDSLLRTHALARSGRAVDAYRQLAPGGAHRIKYFGPSFFTKWLYFSAYESWESDRSPAPLILDRRVALALGWRRLSGWSAGQYVDYLETAEAIRDRWAPNAALHSIEHALFTVGGKA